ncbi:hypothetical protein TRVA0_003S01486 [Trichomonascus vanleenenianus]|uniref:CoA-binding protein n=1 Tax=Trichomonascus vanleenenianus TaxID=2268995 RepID=UPI003EC95DA5
MEHFFKPERVYAVAGASSNPAKFGHKVLQWYVNRDLPVVPINFRKEKILDIQSVENIKDVEVPDNGSIGLSVVTPPAITKQLIQDIESKLKKDTVAAIWLQPGTHDEEVVALAKKVVPIVIKDCILVNGDKFLSRL